MELTAERLHFGAERGVGEQRLHQILAVVERALDRDVADIRRQHGGHLAALHEAGALVRMQDDDVDPVAVGAGLDGGGAGVAGGRADDRHAGVAFGQHMLEQQAEHLHRHVLEGERRTMEQFLREQMRFQLHQRRDRRMAEAGVSVVADRDSVSNGIDSPTNGLMTRAARSG